MTPPLLLGHRGARASRHILENTLSSFELCMQHGCDGFEFDVLRSEDGQAVICHGPVFQGLKIAKTNATDLELPSLANVLSVFAGRSFLDIELKVSGLERETLAQLRSHPPQKGYVVSSFLPPVLTAVHNLDASIPLGFICDHREELDQWRELPVTWVVPHVSLADQILIDEVHSAGKKIMLWTVNGEDQMRQLAAWGADAIISDETELLDPLCGRRK